MRQKGQYKAELIFLPRLHVKPLRTAMTYSITEILLLVCWMFQFVVVVLIARACNQRQG